jgi:uncharacterized protein DUF4276
VTVRLYVEGGGGGATSQRCRQGFTTFFGKVLVDRPRQHFQVIACGSRNAAFDRFQQALTAWTDDLVLLLVDAEGPVRPGLLPWAHLRVVDGWPKPSSARDDQAHLMVECMEAWLLADRMALERFYAPSFRASALPGQRNVETIPKQDLLDGLKRATERTRKGAYDKGSHSFDLLAQIDPGLVCAASPHADRLCKLLIES